MKEYQIILNNKIICSDYNITDHIKSIQFYTKQLYDFNVKVIIPKINRQLK